MTDEKLAFLFVYATANQVIQYKLINGLQISDPSFIISYIAYLCTAVTLLYTDAVVAIFIRLDQRES